MKFSYYSLKQKSVILKEIFGLLDVTLQIVLRARFQISKWNLNNLRSYNIRLCSSFCTNYLLIHYTRRSLIIDKYCQR
jgi:hypothetical protein